MLQTPILLNWIPSPDTDHHKELLTNTVNSVVYLAHNLHKGKIGEYHSIQKLDRRHIPTDAIQFAEWCYTYPRLMRAEWSIMEDGQFIVLQKYFTDILTRSWNPQPIQDFFRLVGDDWSICFKLNENPKRSYDYYDTYSYLLGHGFSSAVCELMTTGDMEAYETDMTLMTLMGHCHLME